MGYSSTLLAGLAADLAAAGIGTYRPTGAYTAAETAIVFGRTIPAPDRLIVLTAYDSDESDLTAVTVAVQVRVRAPDPLAAGDLGDAVFDRWHMREDGLYGDIRCPLSWRDSWVWLGQDDHGRPEATHNYLLHARRASPHLTE